MARSYANPKDPVLGSAYATGDSITGTRDMSAKEIAANTVDKVAFGSYSSVAAGIAAVGRAAGTAFLVGSGLVTFYEVNASTTASAVK